MANQEKKLMTLKGLYDCQQAGGVLDEEPNWSRLGYRSWEEYLNGEFDMADPAMVAFTSSWRKFLDAKKEFNTALMNVSVALGYIEVDGFE